MTAPHNPSDTEDLLEKARRAEVAARRADKRATALQIVFFVAWLYFLWSCRGGCSAADWLFIGAYPALVVFYLIVRRRAKRRILSQLPEYQEALAEAKKERDRGQEQ
jgi:phosphatidylglycerophosphate synthase